MMNTFAIVFCDAQKIERCALPDFWQALVVAGLDRCESIDHGHPSREWSIAVDGSGLRKPPASQPYFAIGRDLYAGNAVIYGTDDRGESVSLGDTPPVRWLSSVDAIEREIGLGSILRPAVIINGSVVWQWNIPDYEEEDDE